MVKKIALMLLGTGFAFGALASPANAASTKGRVPRRLDGVYVAPKNSNYRVNAVMIENHPAARPQASLHQASIVYEALAEGGIPRFMALFAHYGDIGLIGPVRSARPYFLRWAAEYQAAIVHAGGSPDAQILLKKLGLRNIEGLKDPTAKYFFRLGYGVHALFTNGKLLARANAQYKNVKPAYRSWKYVNDPPLAKRRTGKHGATINLGAGANYIIGYAYDRKRNVYLRSTGGKPHYDRVTKKQLSAKNVILQFVPKERVVDAKGRIELKTIGSGRGILLQNGAAITITWRKASTRGRTIFRTLSGQEITLNRGSTWITVVPKGRSYKIF